MQILVYGAGAIGSFIGHRLSTTGHDVTLILRAAQAQTVQRSGLRVQVRHELQVSHPHVAERIEDLERRQPWDCVLLTVKAYDTTSAAQAIAPVVAGSVPVILIQNGVGGEELAAVHLSPQALVSGVITLSVSVMDKGMFGLETRRGGLSLAPFESALDVSPFASMFAAAGIRTARCSDYRAQKWSKLCMNILANAVPAILDLSPLRVYSDPLLFHVERAAFLEALRVMRALNVRPVDLPGYPVRLLCRAMRSLPESLLRPLLTQMVATGRGNKRPSLQLDLSSGRTRSEVAYLNGAVADHSQRLGLHAPVNRALNEILSGIVEGRIAAPEFKGNPAALLMTIKRLVGG